MLERIIRYIADMLPYMFGALLPLAVFRCFWVSRLKRRRLAYTVCHEIGWLLFAAFLTGLASQTIFPAAAVTAADGYKMINLIPFRVIGETWRAVAFEGNVHSLVINFLGNIIIFMPIGFFIPLLWTGVSFRRVLFLTLSISLFIEICQLPQARVTDIDDIWLNTLGGAAGYTVYLFLDKMVPFWTEKFKVYKKETPLPRSQS